MRLTTNGKELKEAILWGAKGTNRTLGESARGAQTVLSVDSGYLHVKSFDGTKFFSARVAVSGITNDEAIEARVYGETLTNAANILTDDPVTVNISETEVTFILPRSEFSIPRSIVGGPQFPELPTKIGTVNAGELRKVSTKAATTALKDSHATPVLGSVLYEFSPGHSRLRLEATNRVSMFIYDLDYVPDAEFENHVTLPEDAPTDDENTDSRDRAISTSVTNDGKVNALISHDLVRVLTSGMNDQDDITLYVNDKYFGVEGGNYSGFVTQIAAEPLNYTKLMEAPTPKQFTAKRKDFITAVKNVTSMSQSGTDSILFNISPAGVLRVTDMVQKARAEVDIENLQGVTVDEDENDINGDITDDEGSAGETQVKFNPTLVLAALNAATSDKVALCYEEPFRPMVFREVKVDSTLDSQFFYMVMPLR